MDRCRVLVVEDKVSVRKLLVTVLGDGYLVSACATGEEAIAELGRSEIDVVLTDIRMPRASGFDVLHAARRKRSPPVVVMLTAYANTDDAVTASRLGAFDYLSKPLDADEVALVVARAADHRRRQMVSGRHPGADGQDPRDSGRCDLLGHNGRGEGENAREREHASRQFLGSLLEAVEGNLSAAAERAAMTPEALQRLLQRYGVSARSAGTAPPPLDSRVSLDSEEPPAR